MDCPSCGGGEAPVFEIAKLWSQLEVQEEDNRVILPRPLRPENICFEKLNNVDLDPDNPVDLSDTSKPVFWDFTEDGDGKIACSVKVGKWPCPVVVETWTVETEPEPTASDCDCDNGQITMYQEETTGWLTHFCVDGVLYALPVGGGGGVIDPGVPMDQVCYDVSSWSFPVFYGGNGGSWDVYGTDVIDAPCSAGPASFTESNLRFACWGDSGSSIGPTASNGWNSVNWQPDTGVAPQNASFPNAVHATESSHGCIRPAFRFDPGFTAGTSGPFTWSFRLTDPGGTVRWGAYDTTTGQQIPVSIISQPAGGSAVVQNGPNGPHVYGPGALQGPYTLQFSLPSGVSADNIDFLFWNVGNSGNDREQIRTDEITGVPSVGNCCIEVPDIGALATLMNQEDSGSGAGWSVAGNSVCNTYASGVGINYGVLEMCGESASPAVETVTSGGGTVSGSGCPNCVTIVDNDDGTITANQSPALNVSWSSPCGFVASGGATATISGGFFDACTPIDATAAGADLADWLNTNYPTSDFAPWWRQMVIGPDGGSAWVIVDVGGTLEWAKTTN
jgi:hypothetical protein